MFTYSVLIILYLLVLHRQYIIVGSLVLSLFLLYFYSLQDSVFNEEDSNISVVNTVNILLMFVLGKDSEWMDRWPSIRIDLTCTMDAFTGMCQSICSTLSFPSIHPIVFSIDPYINIARHLSVLTIYHMEKISKI